MSNSQPDILPLLSRGKHRNPRRGACFMELAAFMAGERWTDHPACTHPVLADLARRVNDSISDAARPRLAMLVPSVIGLTSEDPRWSNEIVLTTVATVLPVVPPYQRGPLAVGLLTCERLLAASGHAPLRPRTSSDRALADFPITARWARAFVARSGTGRATENPAASVVAYAVQVVATSGRADTDEVLADILANAVAVCRELAGRHEEQVLEPRHWQAVCVPVGARG